LQKKALAMEGFQIAFAFQTILQGVPLNCPALTPVLGLIETEQPMFRDNNPAEE
jgi:hypothetical protein